MGDFEVRDVTPDELARLNELAERLSDLNPTVSVQGDFASLAVTHDASSMATASIFAGDDEFTFGYDMIYADGSAQSTSLESLPLRDIDGAAAMVRQHLSELPQWMAEDEEDVELVDPEVTARLNELALRLTDLDATLAYYDHTPLLEVHYDSNTVVRADFVPQGYDIFYVVILSNGYAGRRTSPKTFSIDEAEAAFRATVADIAQLKQQTQDEYEPKNS